MSDRLLLLCGLAALAWAGQASCLVYDEDLLVEGDDDATSAPSSTSSGMGGMAASGGGPSSSATGGAPASSSSSSSSSSASSSSASSSSSSTGGGSTGVAWINEIHYDNDGADTGEGVEIAGTAGLDLSSYLLLLYNGTNGTVYDSTPLSGSIPNQQNGMGCVWFPLAQIQNGSPDGIALIDGQNQVVEFLSYEGTFTAGEDAAMGMMSVDIGVEESTTTPLGQSLQLTGTGNQASSFTWTGPSAESPGQPNAGQTLQ